MIDALLRLAQASWTVRPDLEVQLFHLVLEVQIDGKPACLTRMECVPDRLALRHDAATRHAIMEALEASGRYAMEQTLRELQQTSTVEPIPETPDAALYL